MRFLRQVAGTDAYRVLKVRRLGGALGAEVTGVDLSKPLKAQVRHEIRQALRDHLVICFRDQSGFSRERHLELAQLFGPLRTARHLRAPPTTETALCVEPPSFGGDTVFSNLQIAYDTLSPAMQKLIASLRAVHRVEESDAEVVLPVVCMHPETGRKGLFVRATSTRRIDGFTVEESQPILEFLYRHASRIEYACRIRWSRNMVLVWDNRCTFHSPIGRYDALSDLERVTTGGFVLV